MQQAYLIIDMQNDFIDGTLGTKEAQAIVPRVEKALQTAKRDENNDTDFIFTQDTHDEDYLDTQEGHHLPIMHCVKDSHGWNITKALMPYTLMAEILEKPTFGCTDLVQEVGPPRPHGTLHGHLCHLQCPALKGLFPRKRNCRPG